ncbi:cell wall protein [Rhodotorula toruloides ATCC 204091]|uniref:Cell wall protein n=1 Tax=Rhodotorula toruloides TaxID=5286 RepID=A0A2T0A0K4_RHOTO|nr:cell wall protein [Rhodotorula toruloides ATCC 204091]KAK4335426.1 Cell wall protein [Rhodotorula toruloides]PRQ71558.1 cell wall protein [Rhodotorula toruloides]
MLQPAQGKLLDPGDRLAVVDFCELLLTLSLSPYLACWAPVGLQLGLQTPQSSTATVAMSTPDPSHHDPSSPNSPVQDSGTLDPSYFSPALSASPADPLDPFDPSLAHPPSPGASSTTSSATNVDSLAGDPYADVEARALELLSAEPSSTSPDPGFGWKDIPARVRGPGPTDVDAHEAQSRAIDYLRKMLDEAERDEWMFDTPPVFQPPRGVGVEESRFASRQGVEAGGLESGMGWTDRAFNIERWQVEGLGRTGFEEGVGGFDAFEVGEEGGRFAESEVGEFV